MFLGQDDRAELVHLFVKRFLLAFVKTGILAAMFQMKLLKAMSEKIILYSISVQSVEQFCFKSFQPIEHL